MQSVCALNYTLLSQGLSILAKEFTAATRVIQSSTNEFSTHVSDRAKWKKKTKANSNAWKL